MAATKPTILVTGATGNVGQATLQALGQHYGGQFRVVAAVPDPARAQAQLGLPIEYVLFDFADIATVKAALQGVDKLFLLRPPQISDVPKFIAPVIDAAKAAGVRHIVFLSLQGVEGNPVTPHYKIEKQIKASRLPYTMLRPSFFMQNLSTTHAAEIRDTDTIYIPAGQGRTNFVDVLDLGRVAAMVLAEPGHENQAYELTGSEALTYTECAEILTRVLGRRIAYANPGLLAFVWRQWRSGKPLGFVLVMAALYTVARLGKAAGYSPELERLLGRKPTTFEAFVRRERGVWVR